MGRMRCPAHCFVRRACLAAWRWRSCAGPHGGEWPAARPGVVVWWRLGEPIREAPLSDDPPGPRRPRRTKGGSSSKSADTLCYPALGLAPDRPAVGRPGSGMRRRTRSRYPRATARGGRRSCPLGRALQCRPNQGASPHPLSPVPAVPPRGGLRGRPPWVLGLRGTPTSRRVFGKSLLWRYDRSKSSTPVRAGGPGSDMAGGDGAGPRRTCHVADPIGARRR